jgi:RNA polymerase sigma factor (sigma-70 family)
LLQKTGYTEDELVFLLKQKNEKAFEYLYDNYSNALYNVVLPVVPDEEFAKDVLQKVFVKIWNNIESYQTDKGRLFTWMMNIARNAAIDFTRSKDGKYGQKNFSLTDYVNTNDNRTQSVNIETIGISQFLLALPADMKNVLDLVYLKGHTHEEAAELLQMPLGTVKTKVRNGLIELRKKLSD